MLIKTKIFGEVEISDEKILTFENGIIGFPELKHFTLIHDEEKGTDAGIRYFQSIEEPAFAMPVMNPLMVCETYNPQVSEELLSEISERLKHTLRAYKYFSIFNCSSRFICQRFYAVHSRPDYVYLQLFTSFRL